MNKAKKQFIDKNKAVKFKLVFRSSADPNYKNEETEDGKLENEKRVFMIVENKNKINKKEYQDAKKRILADFDEKELGYFEKTEKNNKNDDILPGIEGRDDLWINHIKKEKTNNLKKETINEENYEDDLESESYEEYSEEMIKEDNLESESFEDEMEIEEKDDKFNEKIEEKMVEKNEEKIIEKDYDGKMIGEEKEKNLAMKMLERDQPVNLKTNFEVNPNIKMKYYDENGFLIDGYDYYQHVAGEVVARLYADYDQAPIIKPDIDYELDEMTVEQKEVFKTLQNEDKGEKYEELEDDFVTLANQGEVCIEEKPKKGILKNKEKNDEKNFDLVLKEFDKKDVGKKENKISSNEFDAILNEHLKEKENRDKNKIEEEIDSDENEKKLKEKYGNDLHTRMEIDRLKLEEDEAMKAALEKSEESEGLTEEDTCKEEKETILTKSLNVSMKKTNLNFIKEDTKIKRKKKEKEKNIDEEENDEKDDEDKKDASDIFKKRDKNESKEEKKKRKEEIKQFKKERRAKKQKFKEEFQKKTKENENIQKHQTASHNIQGYSIYKL